MKCRQQGRHCCGDIPATGTWLNGEIRSTHITCMVFFIGVDEYTRRNASSSFGDCVARAKAVHFLYEQTTSLAWFAFTCIWFTCLTPNAD